MSTNCPFCSDSDLFGDVVVTLDDVDFWLDEVPKIPRTSPRRREWYFQNYNVVNKIKTAKRSGHFQELADLAADRQNLYVAHRLGSALLAA